jgi:hypothetical protein
MTKKIRRRHRADLTGFTITLRSMDNPPPSDEVYEALADAVLEWWRRKKQNQQTDPPTPQGGESPSEYCAAMPRQGE